MKHEEITKDIIGAAMAVLNELCSPEFNPPGSARLRKRNKFRASSG